jgi:uncharacterized protein YecE (DUF72 family)
MELFIGCSGYYYNHWKGLFYPEDLPKKQWLIYYSRYFNTVELNNSFYMMPRESSFKNWYDITPANFVFSVKGYRFFTHRKKLVIDDSFKELLNTFQNLAGILKEKAGPVLWQFPRNFAADNDKLENFCRLLSRDFQHVFEFRNESWFSNDIYEILDHYDFSLCIVSSPASQPYIFQNTSKVAYIRFHGEGSWYNDNYSNESLISWKEKLSSIKAEKLYAYFNNDANAFAVNNGKYFTSLFTEQMHHSVR